jgi:hypothetical protein
MELKEHDKIEFLEDVLTNPIEGFPNGYTVFYKGDYAYPKVVTQRSKDKFLLGFNRPGDWDFYVTLNTSQFKKI